MASSKGDFSSTSVQEMAASLIDTTVPERFLYRNGYTPAEEEIAGDIQIDFSRLSDEGEIGKLRSALSTWGCFQVLISLHFVTFLYFLASPFISLQFSFFFFWISRNNPHYFFLGPKLISSVKIW